MKVRSDVPAEYVREVEIVPGAVGGDDPREDLGYQYQIWLLMADAAV